MNKILEFKSNGVLLRGRFQFPEKVGDGKLPIVIMATGDGLNGSKSSTWSLFAEKLAEAGLISFVFDFAGLGFSEGEAAKLTLTVGLENLHAAVDAVKAQKWVDPNKIGLLGSSFGGNVALLFAGKFGQVKALGLKSPVSFYAETHELMFGPQGMNEWKQKGFDAEYGFNYDFYLDSFNHNTYAVVKNIKVPCLIVHGEADTTVPVVQSKRLAECMSTKCRLELLPGVNHDYQEGDSKKIMTKMIVDWFKQKL
jgi:dipeptidyl aminopeptidase/acylaminoacyl peptidase